MIPFLGLCLLAAVFISALPGIWEGFRLIHQDVGSPWASFRSQRAHRTPRANARKKRRHAAR